MNPCLGPYRPAETGSRHLSFFFSSRRRHTSSLCDWSSDVCSSDLGESDLPARAPLASRIRRGGNARHRLPRSEERRVGKECRSRRSRYYYKIDTPGSPDSLGDYSSFFSLTQVFMAEAQRPLLSPGT